MDFSLLMTPFVFRGGQEQGVRILVWAEVKNARKVDFVSL